MENTGESSSSAKPSTFTLKDEKFPDDVYYEYPALLKRGKIPIVIDNGKFVIICHEKGSARNQIVR